MTHQQEIAEIDLMDAVRDIKGAKIVFLAAIAAAIVLALLVSNFGPKSYVAGAEIVPATNNTQSNGSSTLGQLSGAATLLGVNLSQTGDSDFMEYKELLRSERLASALYRDDALKAIIFPSVWDAQNRQWQEPHGLGAGLKWIFNAVTGGPAWSPPGPFAIKKYLDRNLVIVTDKVTGFFKLSIKENTPEDAKRLLGAIVFTADDLMRQSFKSRAAAHIAYLNKILRTTTQDDQRDAIINLLSSQQRALMLASADPTYAVKVIDPPAADPRPASPKFFRVLAVTIALAIIFVSVWSVLRGYFLVRSGGLEIEPDLDVALADRARRLYRRVTGKKDAHPARP